MVFRQLQQRGYEDVAGCWAICFRTMGQTQQILFWAGEKPSHSGMKVPSIRWANVGSIHFFMGSVKKSSTADAPRMCIALQGLYQHSLSRKQIDQRPKPVRRATAF